MKRRVGLLICGRIPDGLAKDHGNYDRLYRKLLGEATFDYRDYWVIDGDLPAALDECDAFLISGSAHGAYDDLDFINPLKNFIKSACAQETPLAGICFGHQIMALALGGAVEKFSGGWGLGSLDYPINLGAGAAPFTLQAVHQDQVMRAPQGAVIIGTSPFCKIAALSYGNNALSFQPHPEFGKSFMHDLIHVRRGSVFPDDVAAHALEHLEETPAWRSIADKIIALFNRDFAVNTSA